MLVPVRPRRRSPSPGWALNISVRGVLLETGEPLDVGSKLDLTLLAARRRPEVRAVGQVVREARRPRRPARGSGVEFLILQGQARDRIPRFVDRSRRGLSVYEAFYGFTEKPFNLTPDPKYLYLSARHTEAFAHLEFGRRERGGFVVITGEVGTGQDDARPLLPRAGSATTTATAVVLYPALTAAELLRSILDDLHVPVAGTSLKDHVDALHRFLLESRAAGRDVVLLIDEAQDLSPEVLEQIRLISNLETDTEKLIQIVLMGQSELQEMLARRELRQLAQRVTARYHLAPLNREETESYIRHRLGVAGGDGKVTFTAGALARRAPPLGRRSRASSTSICDRALLAGYVRGTRSIPPRPSPGGARGPGRDAGSGRGRGWRPWPRLWRRGGARRSLGDAAASPHRRRRRARSRGACGAEPDGSADARPRARRRRPPTWSDRRCCPWATTPRCARPLPQVRALWGAGRSSDDAPHAPRPGAAPRPAGGPRDVPSRPARHLLPGPPRPRRRGGRRRHGEATRRCASPWSDLDRLWTRQAIFLWRDFERRLGRRSRAGARPGRGTPSAALGYHGGPSAAQAIARFQRDARPRSRRHPGEPHAHGPLQPRRTGRGRASSRTTS